MTGHHADGRKRGLFGTLLEFCVSLFRSRRARTARKFREAVTNLPEFLNCGEIRLVRMTNAAADHYRKFFLWKDREHTRKRWIEAPDDELKALQRRILRLFYLLAPSPYAHGFTIGRGIVSNAGIHTGKKYVIKLDLKDFFPSVTGTMIRRELRDSGIFTKENSREMEILLKLCLLEDRLPQGAPTSPALANLVCRKLDFILAKFARRHGMQYSRYADDLAFSCDSDGCFRLIPVIRKIIEQYGFQVNSRKINVLKRHQRQTVTGLVVNHAGMTSVPRRKRMKLRACLHRIATGKMDLSEAGYAKLKGHVSLIRMANPRQGLYFRKQLEIIEKMRSGACIPGKAQYNEAGRF